ncbi:M20/M25/M40 family metallo-hydrolase [Novosphingobium sp.]|uniref:M20/M25/M40 family metallo-hydrolase n=1 Tax=Novosphingobium sp. TaxID=1874826 RepID=UPI00333F6769
MTVPTLSRRSGVALLALAAATVAPVAHARAAAAAIPTEAEASTALDLAMKAIAIRSVRGEGNRTAEVAALIRDRLVAGGWAPADVVITPRGDTATLVATWAGTDHTLKPLVLSGHMDVVEAKRADWQRDPFGPVVEDGVLYGRGATDMKFDGAMLVSALIDLRAHGFHPRRTIVVAYSGDEETVMATSAALANELKGAEMVVNVDGGGGVFADGTDKPIYWTWDGAEKAYGDYKLEVTNPGGHSSAPRTENAIVQLAQALVKVGSYHFAAELNPITKAWFERAAAFEANPATATAMRAFAANPADMAALAVLRTRPELVGKAGTTCVPTLVSGGHAENALPQRATANINCRIFPGHSREAILAELQSVIGADVVKVTDVTDGSISSPASPMRADFVTAAEKAIRAAWGKDITAIPMQESGASDSMFYRALGVPAYNASPTFTRRNEQFSHGLNERVRLVNIKPALTYYFNLIPDLTK